jgi:hypothetical protein
MRSRHLVLLLGIVLLPVRAAAQTPTPGGPMTFEVIHDGPLAAPDVKITQFDGKTDTLLGGYAGWLTDNRLFVGGGWYWLLNPSRDHELNYGGLILQWMQHSTAPIGFSVRGLIGGGYATTAQTFVVRNRRGQPNSVVGLDYEGFFAAEPQIDALIRVSRNTRVTVGAGYRFTAGSHNDSDIRGAVGTVGFQFGGGS